MPRTFELTLAGSLAVAALVISKGISTTINFVEDQQDIFFLKKQLQGSQLGKM